MSEKKKSEVLLDPSDLMGEIERLKRENSRLKQTVADMVLDISALKDWNDFIKKS